MRLLLQTAWLLAFSMSAMAAENRSIVRIKDTGGAVRQALGQRFGHLPRDRQRGDIVLDVNDADWRWLQSRGYAPRFDAVLSAQSRTTLAKSIPGYACYATVEETDAFIDAQVAAHPTLASAIDIGDSWEKASSGGATGNDLRVLRITNSAITADKPKMFVMSGLHAREYTPVQLNLVFADWLLANYGNDAEATWLVDHHEFHLLLQANPDGRKMAETGASQRKNRHAYGSCSGTGIGVDLNRNFDFFWSQVPGGSSGYSCDATFRGPAPAPGQPRVAEPETRAIDDYINALFPDARIGSETDLNDAANVHASTMYIDLHSYGGSVLYPWGVTTVPPPNHGAFRAMARRMAWFNGYEPGQSGASLYLTDGASDDNAYGKLGVPAFTWELGSAFFESCASFDNELPHNLEALRYAARITQAPYLRAAGPDMHDTDATPSWIEPGTPVTITATVTDARYNQSNGIESIQNIASARIYVDATPWQPGTTPLAMQASDGAFDSPTELVTLTIPTTGWQRGRHLVTIEGIDASGQVGAIAATFVRIGLHADGFE